MAVAETDPPVDAWHSLIPVWHPSAPAQVVAACGDTLPLADWAVWQKYLAERKRPPLPPFLAGKEPPLAWGLGGSSEFGYRCDDFTTHWESLQPATSGGECGLESALDQLGRAYTLPALAQQLPAEVWWREVADLLDAALRAEKLMADIGGDPESLVAQQLLAGELPLALSYLLPEIRSLRELRGAGRRTLSESLVDWTDGEGLPHGRLLPVLGPLWACWTRSRWLGSHWKRGPWTRAAEIQYQWLVRHALRLTGPDGRLLLSDVEREIENDASPGWSRGLYRRALAMAGDPWDYAAACNSLPPHTLDERAERKYVDHELPQVSLNSEWSAIGVLATGWDRSAARFALSWCDHSIPMDFSIGDDRLLAGDWTCRTTCDGEPVAMTGEWDQACWQSNKRCDYLELAIELSHELRLERQVILSRDDDAILIADAILSANDSARRITHRIELPLAAEVAWLPESETRDGLLASGDHRLAVLPLALPEWRSDPRGGRLEIEDGKIVLTMETRGRALYAPLFFDLKRKRSAKQRTWRQLTVAEQLEIVAHDRAVGFRAQSGQKQWLFYRSLGPASNRTLLGQNISGEFYAGRLRSAGKMREWIEVEPVEEDG